MATEAETDLAHRVDPLTGEIAFIVAKRQQRPNLPQSGCPFCPGGLEAAELYEVLSFPNRWPPIGEGRSEVVLYTPRHDATFYSLGVKGARKVVDLWADRSAALGAREDVAYVLPFENRGGEVGATIAHPHGQIYAFDEIPPAANRELASADIDAAFGSLAAGRQDERLVAAHGGWRAWVPWAAGWPYELILAPVERVDDLPSLDSTERDDFAATVVDVLTRYDLLYGAAMPYMLWIHQRPFVAGDWPSAWVHMHLAPIYRAPATQRFVAAGELGSGVYFNPVDPETAAAQLREVGQS